MPSASLAASIVYYGQPYCKLHTYLGAFWSHLPVDWVISFEEMIMMYLLKNNSEKGLKHLAKLTLLV